MGSDQREGAHLIPITEPDSRLSRECLWGAFRFKGAWG